LYRSPAQPGGDLARKDEKMPSRIVADLKIGEIAAIVQRASEALHGLRPAPKVDEAKLRSEVEDLLSAIGIAHDGSEDALLFAGLSSEDMTHKELAKQCRLIAEADDPLDRSIFHGGVRTELTDKLRMKWTSRRHRRRLNRPHILLGMTSDFLSDSERSDIKEAALELEAYHLAQVRRERPTKIDQDTALDGLADIFLAHTCSSQHRDELPHSVRSHFIRFCHAVLRPFFPLTEVSPKALSNRWQKLRTQHQTSPIHLRSSTPPDQMQRG
jgi:hypothetical protein